MSRLGKTPLKIPKGVEVKLKENTLEIKGPKGSLMNQYPEGMKVVIEKDILRVELENENIPSSIYGLHRNLLKNSLIGVSQGYEKRLSLVGIGFRAAVKGEFLDLQLGFSHPSQVKIPKGIQVSIDKGTLIIITGIDKQLVGQFAAAVRALRPPEPYKGKGVRYEDEFVRKKEGKAAAKAK